MRSRRDVLRGITAGVASAVVPIRATADTEGIDQCLYHATKLAEVMRTEHGGIWRISVDKDFVLISKQLVSPSLVVR